MRVIETKVYTFAELSDSAKEVALDNYRDINVHHDCWSEPIHEGFKEQAEEAGFEVGQIYFSGFWSQGDGAMFEYNGFNDNMLKNFVAQLTIKEEDKVIILSQGVVNGKGKHSGHYYHEKCCDHYLYLKSNNPDWEYATDLISQHEYAFEKYVIKTYEDLCKELYRDLKNYYEELTSDEAVQETIEDNEWEFLESGQTL